MKKIIIVGLCAIFIWLLIKLVEGNSSINTFMQYLLNKIANKIEMTQKNVVENVVENMQKSAKSGDSEAAYMLADIYQTGSAPLGVKQDMPEAIKWYQLAVKEGSPNAMNQLAYMYIHGLGVPKDANQALKLFQEAAKLGDYLAVYNLGFTYEEGKYVKQDYNKAAKYYLLAAQHNIKCAENDLGSLYARGKGVSQSDTQAVFWFEKAATTVLNDDHLFSRPGFLPNSINSEKTKKYVDSFVDYQLTKIKKVPTNKHFSEDENYIAKQLSDYYEDLCRK